MKTVCYIECIVPNTGNLISVNLVSTDHLTESYICSKAAKLEQGVNSVSNQTLSLTIHVGSLLAFHD